ncbi:MULTISPECIES: DUF2802 domain-containing protein [Vibrio]|uniref:DUF2802 domain-containing protein n=1 Tax=Vibrio proteolyticus NBRC 13287 TaxID=1219065 RepID=U2ZDX8_VIBPR|nr:MULTISPECIES: DUF2802 domain-containing protein [Vibrio]NAW57189.1 DUF2802 domain-containing protein [Vibrio sp. V36_P2S2PM302]NAX20394.1 DUF2802 domain-containing protein [Vibrio sp. V39_P1S14PM300]NAX24056.1 DUF2802 domain-containing protein [Vibrio sp. V38_P2S17PM301]NAX30026.1 DUF2802 domain-containing protein [Vibrio sp. V37_P2S8PM304]GAD65901.1 hypothetical protein VPR01S_02_01520 [Vibrio proteolyticus NBRC 13287]
MNVLSTNLPLVVIVLAVLLLILGGAMLSMKRGMVRAADQHRQQQRALDKEVQKANKQLLEVRSVVVGLGQRVSEQQDIIQHLNERISELENADNDARLYSRASKMVQLGADVNELIEECELPKAEAELMLSLQKKLAGKERVPPLGGEQDAQLTRRRPVRK